MCNCGSTNVLIDDLLPNKTLRKTIGFFLNTDISSEGTTRSKSSSQGALSDKEPARPTQNKVSSPMHSVTCKGEFVFNPPQTLLKRARCTTSLWYCFSEVYEDLSATEPAAGLLLRDSLDDC